MKTVPLLCKLFSQFSQVEMAEIMFVKSIKNQHLLYLEDKTCLWPMLYKIGQPSHGKADRGEKMKGLRGQGTGEGSESWRWVDLDSQRGRKNSRQQIMTSLNGSDSNLSTLQVQSSISSCRSINFGASQGQEGRELGPRGRQQETLTLCNCTLSVLCSLKSVSLSKAIAAILFTNFLKTCSYIVFIIHQTTLHSYYLETCEL